MEDQNSKSSDGNNAHRVEVGERGQVPLSADTRPNEDGSKGTERPVADVAGSQGKTISKKDQELQLKARVFRDEAMLEFNSRATTKYDKGQVEHGGFLPTDVSFSDIEDEIIDAWFYIQALKMKIDLIMPEAKDVLFHDRCKDTDIPINGCAEMPEVHRNHEEPNIDPYDDAETHYDCLDREEDLADDDGIPL